MECVVAINAVAQSGEEGPLAEGKDLEFENMNPISSCSLLNIQSRP